jgi:hypothetical protein
LRSLPALTSLLATIANSSSASEPVNLTGPEVIKMDWNTQALRLADVDGDGRTDLAMIDNDSGKIELLFQNNPDNPRHKERRALKRSRWEPVLEDAAFWHDCIPMGGYGYDLALGDLNGDGRTDIAFTGGLVPLTLRYQAADGSWDQSWTFANFKPKQWGETLIARDMDGDGKTDLLVMTDDEILFFRQGDKGAMEEPRRYRLAMGQAGDLAVADVNRDGWGDLLFLCGSDRFRRLSMRLQQAPGRFGPEIGFPLPTGSISLAEIHDGKQPFFATIDGLTRNLLFFTIENAGTAPESLATLQGRDYAAGGARQGTLYAYGDFDGDGDEDIATANPSKAEIRFLRQNGEGDFEEAVAFPSYSKISTLVTLRTPGLPDRLVALSSGEDVMGIISYANGRFGLPQPLPSTGKLISAASGNFSGNGPAIALLEKNDDDYTLSLLAQNQGGEWKPGPALTIDSVKRKPDTILAAPILPGGRTALLLLAQKEPVRLFVSADDSLVEKAADSSVRTSCMGGLSASKIGYFDVDGDSVAELLAGGTGFVRALRLKADGALEVAEQYNSQNPEADIVGPVFLKLGGKLSLVFFDTTANRMELLAQDGADKIYRTKETLDWPSQNAVDGMSLADLGGRAGRVLLATSADRISISPLAVPSWTRKQKFPAYETDLDGVHYGMILSGDLTGDGMDEIVGADGRENLLDILARSAPDKPYGSVMHFIVFDENGHAQNRQDSNLEPREMLMGDLNHDGRSDLVLLIHDRVLIYTNAAENPAPPSAKNK